MRLRNQMSGRMWWGSRLEIIEIADVGVLSDLPEQQNLDGTISESPLWHDKRPLPADRAPIDKPDPALHRYRVFAVQRFTCTGKLLWVKHAFRSICILVA
jgi:hypothetical protein